MENELDSSTQHFESKPLCLLVIGMAGSGKTSFVKALKEYLDEHDLPAYTINTDPAVHFLPYEPNIDIRDSLNYKEVMNEYNLGPNGTILTSLNLFATKMNEVVELISNKSDLTNHVIIDTPGQIEVFKWSASGKVIIESLSASFPTAIVYVLDCSRSTEPSVFMSNMVFVTGLAVEYNLPIVIAMNKIDLTDCQCIKDWMNDSMKFADEIEHQDLGYMKTLTRQLTGVLHRFYVDIPRCGVSSYTGDGLKEFCVHLNEARKEFFDVYLKELQQPESENEENADDLPVKLSGDAQPGDLNTFF